MMVEYYHMLTLELCDIWLSGLISYKHNEHDKCDLDKEEIKTRNAKDLDLEFISSQSIVFLVEGSKTIVLKKKKKKNHFITC